MPPIIKFTSVPPKNLYQSILATDYSFKINNIKGWDGADLTSADFGVTGYAVFMNADKTRLEFFEWDPATIASASITITRRGLKFDGDRSTEVPANKLDWTANETTVLLGSDLSQIYQWLKDYIDQIAIAGAPNATTILQGLVQLPTQAQVDAKTGTGSTGAKLAVTPDLLRATKYNDYVADTGAADAYVITPAPAITAYAVGQEFTFIATNANTGASTIDVSGLGVKTIKKNVSEDLAAGDILAGQVIKTVYDGTNFQMVSPSLPQTPIVRTLTTTSSDVGSSTTQFDITNTAGNTYRYTFDGTGTDPNFSLANNPIGSLVYFNAQNFTAANNGLFTVTGAGANYVEVTNASGVAESNKTIGTGYITVSGTTPWTKPAGLKYIIAEVQASGGGGQGRSFSNESAPGGGGGGYTKKVIAASALSSSVYYLIGVGGIGGATGNGGNGRYSAFGSSLYATPGEGGSTGAGYIGGDGGIGVGGDLNCKGGGGGSGTFNGTATNTSAGVGGSSVLGGGARSISSINSDGTNGGQYGGGGSGASFTSASRTGGAGAQGCIIITEYYN